MSQAKTYATISGLFTALAEQFNTLAEHAEMTAAQYIDHLDNPEIGGTHQGEVKPAAEVFAGETSAAAAIFGGAPAPAPAPAAEVTYKMTEKAGTYTLANFLENPAWTIDTLLAEGYIVPNEPPAPAAPPMPVPAATATPVATNVLVDKSGLPWDARIHSGGRTQTKAELWTAKKGVDAAYVAQVTAELRQAGGAPVAQNFTPLNAGAPAAVPPAPVAPPAVVAPPPPAPAVPVPASGPTDGALPTTFTEVCKWVTANGFTMIDLANAGKVYGAESAGFLARPEFAPLIPSIVGDLIASRKK